MKQTKTSYDYIKRILDCIGAGIGLVVLAPVFAVLGLIIRINLGGPVIFAQQRPGKNGELFTMYKFRSMLEEDPARNLVTDDQRSTSFGRCLRATSLDELPTLYNVFKGDMSFVGPRPLMAEYLPLYSKHQARRHDVRPGITGLAQVSGRNLLSWEERFDLDVEYVERRNAMLDLNILARTIGQVFSRSGVEADGITTMTIFVGAPPEDDLSEHLMSDQWQSHGQAWEQDSWSIAVGATNTLPKHGTRHWMYLNADRLPVAICGLSDLGTQHVSVNMLVSPEHRNHALVHALLGRLIHHAKSFDADGLNLRIPPKYRVLHRNAERLGFVAADSPNTTDEDQDAFIKNYSLVLAEEKVA